jgi:hypothetical protein
MQWAQISDTSELEQALEAGEEITLHLGEAAGTALSDIAASMDPLNESPASHWSDLYPPQALLPLNRYEGLRALGQLNETADRLGYLIDVDAEAATMHFHPEV